MKKQLTIADILDSVEFELLQGMLPQDELRDGIKTLRTYQNKARADLFGQADRAPTLDEITDLQLRLNEMMLTLIEVVGQRVYSLQEVVQQVSRLQVSGAGREQTTLRSTNTADAAPQPSAMGLAPAPSPAAWDSVLVGQDDDATPFDSSALLWKSQDLLAEVAEADALTIEPDIRAVNTPVVGGALTRVRQMVHDLVLFYVNQLARRQSDVNLQIAQQLAELSRTTDLQTAELKQIHAELKLIRARLRPLPPHPTEDNA